VHFPLVAVDGVCDAAVVAVVETATAAVVLVIYHYYTHCPLAVHTYGSQHAIAIASTQLQYSKRIL
jgi:hypothetical protein